MYSLSMELWLLLVFKLVMAITGWFSKLFHGELDERSPIVFVTLELLARWDIIEPRTGLAE